MKPKYNGVVISIILIMVLVFGFSLVVDADSTRDVTIKSLSVKVYDTEAAAAVAMPNSEYSISYLDDNDKLQVVSSGTTDAEGIIKDITLKAIPSNVTKLRITYTMGEKARGYIKNLSTNEPYTIAYSKDIPDGNVISYRTSARFATSGEANSYTLHYLVARMNYYYNEIVSQTTADIASAHDVDESISEFQNEPIDLYYERGSFVDVDNGFYRNGHDKSGVSDIVLSDHTSLSAFTDYSIKHAIAHEWTHWNLVRTANLPSGTYKNHYSYNEKVTTSYKEGGPAFVADMLTKSYSLADKDAEVQTDSYNDVNRLYGKSTIRTVEQVLYDLLDTTSTDENESFYVSESLAGISNLTDQQIRQINFGMIYAEMLSSKAQTLSEFLQYLQAKYATSADDALRFQQVLSINGLSTMGNFTLDADGNTLSGATD
ncbi:hypothetical protein [Lactiplantibacillus paraplantarum]|uniref:hypothetical protein n=1 Tax=Lactiplantibacillus paraplantarum TaxID=60520 RepID=UPI003DA509D1